MFLVPYLLRVSTQIAMNALVSVSVPISRIEGSVHSDKTELVQVRVARVAAIPTIITLFLLPLGTQVGE